MMCHVSARRDRSRTKLRSMEIGNQYRSGETPRDSMSPHAGWCGVSTAHLVKVVAHQRDVVYNVPRPAAHGDRRPL